MSVTISRGNSKLGGILNVSLPPGITCRKNVPCYNDGCYARKSYRMYPNVRKAWSNNLKTYIKNPAEYFYDVAIASEKVDYFRWHVGGDIPDQAYVDGMVTVAEDNPLTKYLCFTKEYDYDYSQVPDNLKIVLSIWPGLSLPDNKDLPWAWLEGDHRRLALDQELFLVCAGNCEACKKKCWSLLDKDIHVVFPKH